MATLTEWFERVRGFDLERGLGLRPAWPRVALELDRDRAVVVRLKRRRSGRSVLEGRQVKLLPEPALPASLFDGSRCSSEALGASLAELFREAGVRPGRLSVILPDNLAKISLITLPERPASRRRLIEILRFKMRRAVPFRLNEASLAYELFPAEGKGVSVLVAVMRRSLLEQCEVVLQGLGTRPGLIDVCTTNLLNLVRGRLGADEGAGDAALLNCTERYFSLAISRKSRLIFFRCKNLSVAAEGHAWSNGFLVRELASSLSYYKEKLSGEGIGTLRVRSTVEPFESIVPRLGELGIERIEPVDPLHDLELGAGVELDAEAAQQIAPAIGAAAARV